MQIFFINKVICLKDKPLWLESVTEQEIDRNYLILTDRNYLILTINKRLFTMKVENHDTTKLGNQHENLLKREIQRM